MFGPEFGAILSALPLILGFNEILLVAALLLLFFGGRKIPEFAKGMGTGIRNFKRSLREGREEETPRLPETSTDEVAPES